MALKKWNTNFRLEHSVRKNRTTFLDFPLFLGIFQWDEPTKRVPFTAEPEIPEILSKWKAPVNKHPSFIAMHRGIKSEHQLATEEISLKFI